jgi:3-oxoacyl-[acyl-carrier protein] reductase
MDLGLRSKAAIVAASSRGLGKAVATALAAEGASVLVFSRSANAMAAAQEIRRLTGAAAVGVQADVTRPSDLEHVVSEALSHFGRLDILVNNAGGPPPGTFEQLSDERWQEAVELTLMSAIRLTRLCIPHLRASGRGRIINLTSVATREPIPNLILSNAIRAAVVGWSETLASELAKDAILVNCVAPGRIDTERVRELDEANAMRQGVTYQQARAQQESAIPLGRYGSPDEFGAVVAFLASERASYVTGTTVYVDGGRLASVV